MGAGSSAEEAGKSNGMLAGRAPVVRGRWRLSCEMRAALTVRTPGGAWGRLCPGADLTHREARRVRGPQLVRAYLFDPEARGRNGRHRVAIEIAAVGCPAP